MMPIHATTYRRYEGARRSRVWACLAIARTGAAQALKRRWLIALVLLGVTPSILFGLLIYGSTSMSLAEFSGMAGRVAGGPEWGEYLEAHPTLAAEWTLIFSAFLGACQLIVALIVVTAVGPSLISQDLRARALQLYFARPLTRADYLVGKFLVVAAFVALITLVPGLLLWIVGVVLSRSLVVVLETWRVLAAVVGAGALIALIAGLLVLTCSCLSLRAGYAALAWVSVIVLSETAYVLLRESMAPKWGYMVSLRAHLWQAIGSLFGAPPDYPCSPGWSWLVLGVLVGVLAAVLLRRIRRLEGEH
jgi:ABC-2 type transport system permease protein